MPNINNQNIGLGDTIWAVAQNQVVGNAPPPGTDVNELVFVENPFYGSLFGGGGPYSGWGLSGQTNGDDRIYSFSTQNSNFSFRQWTGTTYWYDNNFSGGWVGSFDSTNYLPPSGPPFFYNNMMNVQCQLYDSTYTVNIAGGGTNVPPNGGIVTNFVVSNPTTPNLAILYWKVIIGTTNCDPAATVSININNVNYVSSAGLTQFANNVFDFQTYGTANAGSTSQGWNGAYFKVVF